MRRMPADLVIVYILVSWADILRCICFGTEQLHLSKIRENPPNPRKSAAHSQGSLEAHAEAL